MKNLNLFLIFISLCFIAGCAGPQIYYGQTVVIPPDQMESIRAAAAKVLPPEADVQVTARENHYYSNGEYVTRPAVVISAHLLEGHSPDENSPYVRGDYGSEEKLTRLIRYRCAKIIKSVATESQIPEPITEISIDVRHGVRQYIVGSGAMTQGSDVAMTIYSVGVPVESLKGRDLSQTNEEQIMELWNVNKNIIPSLQFQTVTF